MKAVFVNLYPDDTIARYLLSSYLLSAYLGEYFPNNKSLDKKILNFSHNLDTDKIYTAICNEKPDVISYSCYVWNIKKIAEIAQKIQNNFKCTQLFGGPDITPEKIISTFNFLQYDSFFIVGEGERKLLRLLIYLSSPPSQEQKIPDGVAYWKNKELRYSPDPEFISDLDEIPSIYLNNYIEDRFYAYQQAFLETQRGCHFRCKYCIYHKHNAKIAYYSIERIFDELDYLIITKKIKALRIFDSVFTSDLPRAKEIVRHLIDIKKRNQSLPWIYWEFTHISTDEEFLHLVSLLKAEGRINNSIRIEALDRPQHYNDMLQGYTVINCMGIQSFSDNALRAVGRPKVNKEKFEQFMALVKKYNVVLKIDVILGLPRENIDTYFAGLEYLIRFLHDTDHILNIHRLQILPGSDLEKIHRDYGIEYSLAAPYFVFSTQEFSAEDMQNAAKLTAILFRIINSPLRSQMFATFNPEVKTLKKFLSEILSGLKEIPDLQTTDLLHKAWIDDNYWNTNIYSDVPTEYLKIILNNLGKNKLKSEGIK